jgi:DNA-binding MarR family transcriptional regulator
MLQVFFDSTIIPTSTTKVENMNEYIEINKALCERRRKAALILKPQDFTPERFIALWAVRDGSKLQNEVAFETGILAPSLCRIVDWLVDNNFAEIVRSNFREAGYKPTRKGRNILNRYIDQVEKALGGIDA